MGFLGGYPDKTFADEPDVRRPLLTNGPVNDPRGLASKLPKPISAKELDILHALESDVDICPCIDDWAENSMFESSPSNKPTTTADNSDIDNFLRELREFKESGLKSAVNPNNFLRDLREFKASGSKSAENPNGSCGHRSSTAQPPAALNNPDGFATSRNHMGKMPEGLRPAADLENPVINPPVQNNANIMGPVVYGYPQPGSLTPVPNKPKKRAYRPKVLRSPTVYPKPQISATPTKASLQVHLGAPEMPLLDEKQTYRHKMGKSNPASGKQATEAKAAPSVSNGEPASRPSNTDTEGVSSTDSDTTGVISSKSRDNSGSSDSTIPDISKGALSAPKSPPAPASGGPVTRTKSAGADRVVNGKNSASAVAARRNAYHKRYMAWHQFRTQSGPPSGNGENGEGSSNPDGANLNNHKRRRTGDRWLGFLVHSSNASGVEASPGGLGGRNSAPLPVMNGVNGSSVDNGPLASYHPPPPCGSTTHNGPMYGPTIQNSSAMENDPIQVYVAPMQNSYPQTSATMPNSPMPHIPSTYGYQMHGGPIPPLISPMQNGPVPATGAPMQNFPVPPFVAPMQNGPAPWNGVPFRNDTMLPNSALTQNFSVPGSRDIPFMRNYPMPSHAAPMQNGTVPPNRCLTQNGAMPQHGLPIQNGSVPQYGPHIHNGSVPQYGPHIHNGSVPQYGPPIQNGSGTSYGTPMHNVPMPPPPYGYPIQNGTMPANNATIQDGHMPAYSAPIHNGAVLVYAPPMPNPLLLANGGNFVNAANAYISIGGDGFQGHASNGQALNVHGPNGQARNIQAPSGTAPPNMQGPSGQGASGYVSNGPNGCAPKGQA
ncbi:hypothetical protein VE02_04722 [Pseudogymnoascus sp. 03VT05]|nr:hypothetical protein VE02_04722 [Pseudogymnoascus sp. 03VT05]